MKKFQFRLETLLKFRKLQEEKAQLKLAEAASRLQKERELLNLLCSRLASNLELLGRQQSAGAVTVETLTTISVYTDKVKREITGQQQVVAKAAGVRDHCLAELEQAVKQRKLVANLRQKRLEQYHYELLQEEQSLLDELGTQAFVRDRESDLT